MNTSALTTTGDLLPDPITLIEASGRAESTRRLYTRVLAPYLENGGNLAHVDSLRVYAETLPASRRRHLRAAVSLWAKETAKRLKAMDTPERHTLTETLLNRLEALPQAIQIQESKGQKAHTWLSPKQVKQLMATCDDSIQGQRDRIVLALLVGAAWRREG